MIYKYDDDLIGYTVTLSDSKTLNFQFDKILSNHPQPDYVLKYGCHGDDTFRQFNDDDLKRISEFLLSREDVKRLIEAFNTAIYDNAEFRHISAPVSEREIFCAAQIKNT